MIYLDTSEDKKEIEALSIDGTTVRFEITWFVTGALIALLDTKNKLESSATPEVVHEMPWSSAIEAITLVADIISRNAVSKIDEVKGFHTASTYVSPILAVTFISELTLADALGLVYPGMVKVTTSPATISSDNCQARVTPVLAPLTWLCTSMEGSTK